MGAGVAGVTELPVIDLSPAEAGRYHELADEIDAACRDIGFFAVVGHEVPDDLFAAVLGGAAAFFDLPVEAKRTISIDRSQNHTGYVAIEAEQLQADLRPDMKESLDFALEPQVVGAADERLVSQYPAVGGFAPAIVDLQAELLRVAQVVLRAIATALAVDAAYFARRMLDPQCFLRVLHYPEVRHQRRHDQLGCGAHTDYGLITLLHTDGTPGLELRDRAGDWSAARVPADAMVVNLGDMLARWTNDRYVSTMHRVSSPEHGSRFSLPFFVNPDPHTMVTTIPSCLGADGTSRYDSVEAAAYLQSRFDDTHAYLQ